MNLLIVSIVLTFAKKSEVVTRSGILQIALEQFSRNGVKSVTMDDIARQGGISKKTIYLEFANKKELVKDAFAILLEEDRRKMMAILDTEDGVIEHLVKTSRMVRERLQSINPLAILEVQKYFPEAWQMLEDFKVEVIMGDLIRLLEKGKALGYFRPEIDVHILAKIRVSQITSIFDPDNFARPDFNLVEEQSALLDHFLHGIFTEKGRSAYAAQQAIED